MMMPGFGFGGMGFPAQRRFEEQYHCYSVAYADKTHLEVSTLQICPQDRFSSFLIPTCFRKEIRFFSPHPHSIPWLGFK